MAETTEKPCILLSHEMLMPLQAMLEATYEVVRLWDHPDTLGFLSGPGLKVQAIVHAGEMPLPTDLLAEMPRLGLIACVSAGYDGVPMAWCRQHGIAVTHSTGVNAEDVADVAVGLLIGAWRGIVEGDRRVRDGRWGPGDRMHSRRSLRGRKAGVVGLGHIGDATARRLEAFGMTVSWWGPNPKESRWPRADSVMALARDSDVLVVACRATPENKGLISAAVIEALGPQGCLVNVARGSVIDEDAMIAALKDGKLGMAALDVFEEEPTPPARWEGVPHTVLTPHLAGATVDAIPQMVGLTVENLRAFFHGEPLPSPVQE
ncbi:2-hydroxyacid dehydrogenase [Caulobacter segnis]|uniref:2-hydroxyacid dehydrogenase n=1 Tax=Caulobacter segnis TaxID=88688 RepID=UPI00240FD90F|nr:2-hydroxyacid dehydrogenase [Caulobacter segnis]MDG2522798.1 2-hydroxyacid dehydrogenase [Caulobacter segnis]